MEQQHKKKILEDLPYCFNSSEKAVAAVTSLKRKFDDKVPAYSIGSTLFVRKHDSLLMNMNVHDFIRSLGGVKV